jgi:hypothetical protein
MRLCCVLCTADESNGDTVVGPFHSARDAMGWIGDDAQINGRDEGEYSILPFVLRTSEPTDDYGDDCPYCGGNCPNEPEDSENLCDGYAGDIDGLCEQQSAADDL